MKRLDRPAPRTASQVVNRALWRIYLRKLLRPVKS